MHQALLTKLGLRENEGRVYESILNIGLAGVSDIATSAGLYRPAVYSALTSLVDRGLVVVSRKGKRKVFAAESPQQLEKLVKSLENELEVGMPELMSMYASTMHRPFIRYFEGAKGIRHVYEDLLLTLKKGDVAYRYESPKDHKEYARYIPNEYRRRILDETEVDWYIITNEITYNKKKRRLGRLFKMIPPEYGMFAFDITQHIYQDKVAFIDFKNETASIIESVSFAQFQKQIFRLLFDKL
jgi:sugar-specific transcriptional regulator TrmB